MMAALHRHLRFLVALVCGLVIWVAASVAGMDLVLRALAAANGFFAIYLIQLLHLTVVTSAQDLRRHAEIDDEGAALILLLAVVAVVVSVTAVFLVLNRHSFTSAEAVFALAAPPLGWLLLHMLVAYRYAHLYYSPGTPGGLKFPQVTRPEPTAWDFVYVAFTIGMTAQVSDVQVTSQRMRKVVLVHAVGAFFYNTVILALAVNAGLALSR